MLIKVTAGDGRTVPFPANVATAPGARLLMLKPGEHVEVDGRDPFVVRSLANGDLVKATEKKER